jgi:mono/diheme cytochrome c family protein
LVNIKYSSSFFNQKGKIMIARRISVFSSTLVLLLAIFGPGCASADLAEPGVVANDTAVPQAQQMDEGFPVPQQKVKPAAGAPTEPVMGGSMTPLERVASTPKGELKNPYVDANDKVLELGRKKFLSASCNGCHGGTGGGGMCPPLSNEVWVYGSDDDTLYRLIALGSDEFIKQTGISRKGRENVVGPMPGHGAIVKTDDDMWKIITFIRSVYRGDPARKNW